MVQAYLLAVEKCDPGDVYNICTGRAIVIGDMLNMLIGMSKTRIDIRPDPARMRPSDVPVLLGDNSKFVSKTGWKAGIPFEKKSIFSIPPGFAMHKDYYALFDNFFKSFNNIAF